MSVDHISKYSKFRFIVLLFFAISFGLSSQIYASNKKDTKENKVFEYQNPIYGSQSEMKSTRNKMEFTGDTKSPWGEVGHNEVFTGSDGKLWISCHGILKEERIPYLVIDPIEFKNGEIKINGPTHTKQVIKY